MSEELRACPLCSRAPTLGESSINWGHGEGRTPAIKCRSCGLEITAYADPVEVIVSRWNTRPLEDALQAKVDALVELVGEQDKRFAHLAKEHGMVAQSHARSVSDARAKCHALGVDV